jgi:hypothetical protein
MDWVIQCSTPKVRHLLDKVAESHPTWEEFLDNLNGLFPKLETDFSLEEKLQKLALLSKDPTPTQLEVMLLEIESLMARMTPESLSQQEKLLLLMQKLHPELWRQLRERREWRPRTETYTDLKELLREKAKDDFIEKQLFHRSNPNTNNPKKVLPMEESTSSSTAMNLSHQEEGRKGSRGGKGGQGKGKSRAKASPSRRMNPSKSQNSRQR